jgi:hypothetical protein
MRTALEQAVPGVRFAILLLHQIRFSPLPGVLLVYQCPGLAADGSGGATSMSKIAGELRRV